MQYIRLILVAVGLWLGLAVQSWAAEPVIEQGRGVDPGLDYKELTRFGPWDDRNYALRREDVALLPEDDYYVPGVPAFFKVQKRKEMAAEGFPLERYYPRELDKEFRIRYAGLMQNGVLKRQGLGKYYHPDPNDPPPQQRFATDPIPHAVPVEGEGPFESGSDNETTIEYHPTNPLLAIAGSNGSGGQRHAFTSDGGLTWFSAGALPASCCDPAMDWSPDGTVAYTATLGTAGGCGFSLCTQVYRSTNNGQTWVGPINLSTASSDKEFIHVDRSPTSPFQSRVYATWHQGNVMQFARSTCGGPAPALPCTAANPLAFSPAQSFAAEERGIGSDITTDAAGRIYYVWPSVTNNSAEIRVVRSTDGGVTFTPSVQVYELWGDFDFAIPSMETRRAFIYVSADVDTSGGPHDGRVYVAFTDKHPSSPPEGGGTAAQNHAWIRVAYSDDQGATWQVAATPHAEADIATVDRYHPWLDVDTNGIVHIGFYDTRNSTNRTGVDWYYAFSSDGGASWLEETRVSAIVSQNITDGQEWGDYNGLSVSAGATVGMTWTDNRITPPAASAVQLSFAGRVTNVGAGPTFLMSGTNGTQSLCTLDAGGDPDSLFASGFEDGEGIQLTPISLTLTALNGFTSPVSLSFQPALPPGFAGTITPSTVNPPGTSTVNLALTPDVAPGDYDIGIQGSGGSATRVFTANVVVVTDVPGAPVPALPANEAVGVSLTPTLTWTAPAQAGTFLVEVATDAAFANIVFSGAAPAGATAITVSPALTTSTTYFWRLRSTNLCGLGDDSVVAQFTTRPPPGQCPAGTTTTDLFFDDVEGGTNGWTATTATGSSLWQISTQRPFGGTGSSWLAIDVPTASDQRLTSPVIVLPSGQSPLSLQFQSDQTLERRTAGGCWDGGLLEITTNGGTTWTQIPASAMLSDPYDGALNAGPGSGLQAWCGDPQAYLLSIVDLSDFAGQTVQLRFRVSTDTSVGREPNGWYVDNIRVQSCVP